MTDGVVLPPRNGLSLASGAGGLDMGLMLAEPGYHTRCFVEYDRHPREALVAAMRAGYFAQAPIWDDVTTFDARPLAGAIDTVIAGYPCQPFSQAGQRRGEDDERHLWPDIERIIGELGDGLRWCFFENVAGHLTLGLETVLRALRDMGFTPASGVFSAAEVGAPHKRERVFVVAHRAGRGFGKRGDAPRAGRGGHVDSGRGPMAHARGAEPQGIESGQFDTGGREKPDGHSALCGGAGLFPPGPRDRDGWSAALAMAPDRAPAVAFGDIARRAEELVAMAAAGELAQAAAESDLRRMVDGLARRTRALRMLGNGVVPLAAAHAWRTLSAAHGLGRVDLGTIGRSDGVADGAV